MEEIKEVDGLLSRLSEIPLRIFSAVQDHDEMELHTAPAENDWSAVDIFAHLRASDDILAPRAYMLLTRVNPPLITYDDRRWAEVARYVQVDFRASLTLYTLRRAELVHMLRHIKLDDWHRVGIHEERGPISLLQIITRLVEHEEEHCAQLEAIYTSHGQPL